MLFLPLSNAQDAGEYTVTESGDMDADAFADVIVANPDGSITGPITPGEVSIYSGANGSLTITFKGKKPGDSFGYSVAHTGDYNGDGFFDLLIGSPLEEAGRAYTFFGPFINSGPPLTITADAADLMFISPDADAYDFGDLVAPLTDIDGDGLTDARIRSWFLDAAGLETMRTYIVSGETGMPLFTITGNSPFDPWAFVEGDTDDDGDVDQADLDIIIFNLGLTGLPGSLTVTDGDVDGDGTVTAADLALAMANLGTNPFLTLILLTPEAGGGMPGQWVEDWDGTMIWLPDNVVREMRIFLAGGICSLDISVYADGQKIDPFQPGNYEVDSSSLIRLESPLQAFFEWTWLPHPGREVALELISSNIANPFIFRAQGQGRGTMLGDNDVSPDGVLGNCFEYIILDLIWVDTDKDGMPNGWEIEHGLDPTIDDSTLDADGDGLINLSEYFYSTNPSNPDTDGDGASDGAEVGWGGSPTDATDMGVPPAPEDLWYVNFCVGDQGFSNGDPNKFSELWELNFNGATFHASPDSPTNEDSNYEFTSCGFAGDLNHANAYRGVWAFRNPLPVIRGGSYTISLNWLSTIWPNGPDHDWTLAVTVTDANGNTITPGAGDYILSDPDSLLGTHYDQDTTPNQTPIGKTVTLEFPPVTLKLKSVAFGGAGGGPQVDGWLLVHHDIDQQVQYESPQWLDSNLDGDTDDPGERSYPVAYVGGFNPLVEQVRFSADFGSTSPNSIEVTGTASNGMVFSGTGTVVGNEVVANNLTADQPFPTIIRNIDPFSITWSVALNGGQPVSTSSPLVSSNTIYVLAKQPDLSNNGFGLPMPKLHTLFDIGCRNADGMDQQTSDQTIIDAIWLEFEDKSVFRAEDDQQMSYYLVWACGNLTTATLVKNLDGQCGSWVQLFLDTMKLLGISLIDELAYLSHHEQTNSGFLVKEWNFSGLGSSGHAPYPYLNIPSVPFTLSNPNRYNWGMVAEVTELPGISAQGPNSNNQMFPNNPDSFFNNHQVIRIVNSSGIIVYDPSYGEKYIGVDDLQVLWQLEGSAIHGYYVHSAAVEQGFGPNGENVDLNQDGMIGTLNDPADPILVYFIKQVPIMSLNDLQFDKIEDY